MQLGANFAVLLAADKNFYLRLMVEKIHAFAVFNDKDLQLCGCSDKILRLRSTVQILKLKY